MREFITVIVIAVALSMDTFSISLGLGISNLGKRKMLFFPILVGSFHFMMPLLGNYLGIYLSNLFNLNTHFLLGIILIYLALAMIIEALKQENKKIINTIELIILAITVSIDSFSTGIGISALSSNILLCVSIFALISSIFTYIGLLIGKYASRLLGVYSSIFGSILLLIIGIFNLCK